jgi:hypothetical protein
MTLVLASTWLLSALSLGTGCHPRPDRQSGPVSQEAYLWQRSWGDEVRQAVRTAAPQISAIIVLASEVTWENGQPRITRVSIDYGSLQAAQTLIGLSLRIGAYPGPFRKEGEPIETLADLSSSLIAQAQASGLSPQEFQIDFDCAESKLDGYRAWVEAIRERIRPTPITVTVLPSWLKQSDFAGLAEAADGLVLQVHWLAPPRDASAPLKLFDPAAIRQWMEVAANFHRPFRLALPTYSYLVAFDRKGKFIGLSAEGPALTWPPGAVIRRVDSDPAELADLIHSLSKDRPANLTGVIWYRLPMPNDRLNWSWPTLAAVMQGRQPRVDLQTQARHTAPGLVDIDLVNAGEKNASIPVEILVRWQNAKFLAGDALAGFTLVERGTNQVSLRWNPGPGESRIAPGEKRAVGWLRFDRDTEVTLHVSTSSP